MAADAEQYPSVWTKKFENETIEHVKGEVDFDTDKILIGYDEEMPTCEQQMECEISTVQLVEYLIMFLYVVEKLMNKLMFLAVPKKRLISTRK